MWLLRSNNFVGRRVRCGVTDVEAHRPPTRSFQPRRRKLSVSRAAQFDELFARWSIPVTGPSLQTADIFGRDAPVILDVGFGGGEATIAMAVADPARNVIAIEVHTPGISNVLDAIHRQPITNVRVVDGDVQEFIDRLLPGSLDEIRIYFPDPWPKMSQRRRRLVQAGFIARVVDLLAVGGRIHLATDIADYATQMQTVCDAFPQLTGGVVDRPSTRPLTRFEQRGLNENRPPTDLTYHRVKPPSSRAKRMPLRVDGGLHG